VDGVRQTLVSGKIREHLCESRLGFHRLIQSGVNIGKFSLRREGVLGGRMVTRDLHVDLLGCGVIAAFDVRFGLLKLGCYISQSGWSRYQPQEKA